MYALPLLSASADLAQQSLSAQLTFVRAAGKLADNFSDAVFVSVKHLNDVAFLAFLPPQQPKPVGIRGSLAPKFDSRTAYTYTKIDPNTGEQTEHTEAIKPGTYLYTCTVMAAATTPPRLADEPPLEETPIESIAVLSIN